MTAIRWIMAHMEYGRAELAAFLFGQCSTWDYCRRCWRRGDWQRPLHKEVDAHPRCYWPRYCEPCTTILGTRQWPCDNCGLTREDFDRYILRRDGLVRA